MSKRILLAIDNQKAEEIYEQKLMELSPDFKVVSKVVHKDSIEDYLSENHVDILMMIEGLNGNQDDFDFVIKLKTMYPELRIIFVAHERNPGDLKLASLVSYQIFDILSGNNIMMTDMLNKTINPTTWKEASVFLPKSANKPIFKESEFEEKDIKETEFKKDVKQEILENDETKPKEFGLSLKDRLSKKNKPATLPEIIEATKTDEQPPHITMNTSNSELENMKKELEKSRAREARLKKEKETIEKEALEVYKKNQELFDEYNKVKREYTELDKSRNSYSKQKVVTFYGAMPGVGNSTAALNVATYLAMKGQKVIYIEFNDLLPTLSYWFDMGDAQFGLESAFLGIETRNYQDISKCIITKDKLLAFDSDMKDKHTKYPDSLSFMFFSDKHIKKGEAGKTNPNTLKDLLLFLLYKDGYDYVILDIYAHVDFHIIETASIFSSINVFSMTQDIVTIGTSLKMFSALKTNGLEFEFLSNEAEKPKSNFKNIYLVNKYLTEGLLNQKKIKDWLESDKIVYIPENSIDIVNGLFKSMPAVLYSKNKEYLASIKHLVDSIDNQN